MLPKRRRSVVGENEKMGRITIVSSILAIMLCLVFVLPVDISPWTVDSQNSSDSFKAQSTVDWWPMFRHDLSHTGYSTSWAPSTNRTLWNYPTSGAVESSPAVSDGMVFVGSYDNTVYALNYSTGELAWTYTTGGAVASSPAVSDGMVFVGSYDNSVYALSATTGALIWSYPTNDWVVSSPAVADGKVFVGSYDTKIYAFDAFTGAFIWSYPTGDYVRSSPAVADGKVFVGSFDSKVYALDASMGTHLWNYPTGGAVYSSPAYSYVFGMVYVGSLDGNVYALDASTGEEQWSYFTGQNVVSSPAVAYDNVYVGSYYEDGKVCALDAYNGDLVWVRTTGNHSVVSSPAVASGKVYVGSNDWTGKGGEVIGKVCALDAWTGEPVWNYTTGGIMTSSPAVADGNVYVGSGDTKVYAFGIPVLSAWASTTPTIDGSIFSGKMWIAEAEYLDRSFSVFRIKPEWFEAARVDFTLNYESESHPATLYVMNDYINLYIALEVRDEDFDDADLMSFDFDNDHNRVRDIGDNHLRLWAGFGGAFVDGYWVDGFAQSDTEDSGSNDGAGNSHYRVETSTWEVELVYPLNSSDNDHDFSLSVGSPVGFSLGYYDDGGIEGYTAWPSNDFSCMATIRIAGPSAPPPATGDDLRITGIEVTQAIQDLSNSLRLVEQKTTAVRIYVDVSSLCWICRFDVTVYLYGSTYRGSLGALQTSFGAPINAELHREDTEDTANFLLPSSWTQEVGLTLTAFAKFPSSARRSETDYSNNWMARQSFEFHHTTEPWVYIVPINRGTAANPDLPTDQQIADTQSYFRAVYPVSTVNFVQTLPIFADGHSSALNFGLEIIYTWLVLDGVVEPHPLDQIYGLHSGTGGVASPIYCDCMGVASSGGSSDNATMSHEICHNWGPFVFNNEPIDGWGWGGHVPFNGPNDFLDLSWPYPNGEIQEFGFDTRSMTVVHNSITFDFMTYDPTCWISPYRWEAAFDLLQRGYRFSIVDGSIGTMQQGGESLVISGWVSSNGSGSLNPIFQLPSVIQSNSTPGTYALILQDNAGHTLLTHSFKPSKIVNSEPDDPYHFCKVLPYINGTARVLLMDGNATLLDEIVMSQHAPTVTVLSPNGGENWTAGVQTIAWTASDLDGDPLTYQVFYSTDNGTAWRPLALSLTQTYFEIDASLIPGSPSAFFKVVASDGFNIGEDISDNVFTVADKPPRAIILRPEDEAQFLMHDVILLDGYGADADDFMLSETAYNWTSDIDGYLGNGTTITTMLTLGTHNITLTITDSQGNIASDTIRISVTPYFEIASIAPSKTVVGQGFSTPVNVTVTNRGPITQNLNVAVYANMTASAEQWDEFGSMGDVNRDGHINQADMDLIEQWFGYSVPPAPPECDLNSDGEVDILDAAILGSNYGLDIWTYFGLSTSLIGAQNVTLPIVASETLAFAWNSTSLALGNYTIWAYAQPAEGEMETADNMFIGGGVFVTIPGDVNGDRKVDMRDIGVMGRAFSSVPTTPEEVNADIWYDRKIDMRDIGVAARNFGQSW